MIYFIMVSKQYERWFKKCRKNGVNVVRLWCGDEYFNPDGDDVGSLRYEQFTKLDLLVKLAEKYQIKLKLTFEHFRYFSSDGKAPKIFEKELAQNGVSCKSMTEWLTDLKWKDAWVLKINEFAKRYAGDVNFFAFEFWNEMNCVDADFDSVIEWNREMADRARVLFPDNMVINSLGSFDCSSAERQYQKFPWEAFSFKQIHSYLDSGAEKEVCRHSLIELMADNLKKNQPESCPVVVAETGAVNNCHSGPFRFYVSDDNGIIFADAVFTPFFLGSAGCGNIWHWSDYVEAKGLFKMYKPFYKLTRDIDFARESFVSRDMSDENVYALILEGKNHILAYIRNCQDNWENSLRDQKDLKSVSVDLKIGGYSDVKLYRIWDDKIKAKKYSDGVRLSGIVHGLFLKFIT